MKTSKLIYSQLFPEYALTNDKLKKLHNTLSEILKEFDEVCRKNKINYMLSGGTLLGSIRHKGFIPWDDDIDVMMTRKEFTKLKKIYKADAELAKKYELAIPGDSSRYVGKMVKLYKKGTKYVEIQAMRYPMPKMIFMDIFIIENAPNPSIARIVRSFWHDICFRATSLCLDYKYPSPLIMDKCKTNKEMKRYYNLRRVLGAFFTHIGGYAFYSSQLLKMENYKKQTKYMCIPSAISYSRELFDRSVFTQITNGTFCGYEVKIPKQYDKYLKNLYGENYMQIPPKNKREIHVSYECNS